LYRLVGLLNPFELVVQSRSNASIQTPISGKGRGEREDKGGKRERTREEEGRAMKGEDGEGTEEGEWGRERVRGGRRICTLGNPTFKTILTPIPTTLSRNATDADQNAVT
jgi:hypothetical protein